ncbi:hypothetical protein CDAR_301591 [Caerostris darwini]|uniref:Uncharacterized protein n=1 Tax=Caerostris darwini TaxID=1538125 RepID=A0AAV4TP43_9ARAC|nr:hypothetical protein CDAR_301591 [Caerostris darwini]
MYSSSDEESSTSSGSGGPVYNLIGFKEIETVTGKRRMGIYAQKCSKSKGKIFTSVESSKASSTRASIVPKENEAASERRPSSNLPLKKVGESSSIPKKGDKIPVRDNANRDYSALANRSISIFGDVIDRIQKKGLIICESSIREKSDTFPEGANSYSEIRERSIKNFSNAIDKFCRNAVPSQDGLSTETFDEIPKQRKWSDRSHAKKTLPECDDSTEELWQSIKNNFRFSNRAMNKDGKDGFEEIIELPYSLPDAIDDTKRTKLPNPKRSYGTFSSDASALANKSISIFCDVIDKIQKKGLVICESYIHEKSDIFPEERKVAANSHSQIRVRCIKNFSNAIDKFCRNAVPSQDGLSTETFDEIPKQRKWSDRSHAKKTLPECDDSTEELQQSMNYPRFSNRAMNEDGEDGSVEITELPCSPPDVSFDTKSTKLPKPERSYGTFSSESSAIDGTSLNLRQQIDFHDRSCKMKDTKYMSTSEMAGNDDCCACRLIATKSRLQNVLRELAPTNDEDTEMIDKYCVKNSSFPAREMLSKLQVYFTNNPLEVENISSQERKQRIIHSRYFSDEFKETVVLPLCKYMDTDENLHEKVLMFSQNETLDDLPGYSSEREEPLIETSDKTKAPEKVKEWLGDEPFYEEAEESTEDEDSQDEVLYETLKESVGEESETESS